MSPTAGVPRISVVVPFYNAEATIAETIESLRAQTFSDFEAFILNDGSTDRGAERARAAVAGDPRFQVLDNPKNRGVCFTRNRGIELARAPWMAILDADDVALPQRLARQLEFVDRNKEIVLLGSSAEAIAHDGHPLGPLPMPTGPDRVVARLLLDNPIIQSAVLVRLDAVRRIGGYTIERGEDYDLWWRLRREGKLDNIAEPLVRYRSTPGSIMDRFAEGQRAAAIAISRRAIGESLQEFGVAAASALDPPAHERLWRCLHTPEMQLRAADSAALAPLWTLLEKMPAAAEAYRDDFRALATRLYYARHWRIAGRFHSQVVQRLGASISAGARARCIVGSLLPPALLSLANRARS